MLIDVHAHLNNEEYSNIEQIVENAKENGVEKIITATCDDIANFEVVKIAKDFSNVFFTLGIHPQTYFQYTPELEEYIISQKDNPKFVAIGEIGLDFHEMESEMQYIKNTYGVKLTKEQFYKGQIEVFKKQIELANKLGKPIVIHSRDATEKTMEILKSYKDQIKNGCLIHCFSGSEETAKQYFDMGFYISVGGVVTFKNAKNLPEIIKNLGIEKVMLETDCPYLAPEPFRGTVNEPKNVKIVAEKLAEILNISFEEVEKITSQNAERLFKI